MAETDERVEEELAKAIAAKESSQADSAFLMGYVVVAEWMDFSGRRWLTRRSATGQGEWVPPWVTRGYLSEALNHWPELEQEIDDVEDDID